MPTSTPARRLSPGHFRALAARGLRTPIGTDLVLHERPDPEAVRLDGRRLAGVVREAAERYRTTLAIPLMDLRLEMADLVHRLRPEVNGRRHLPLRSASHRGRPRPGPRRGRRPVPGRPPGALRCDRRRRRADRAHSSRHHHRALLAHDEAPRRPHRRRGPGRPRRSRRGRAPRGHRRAEPPPRRARRPPLPARAGRGRGGSRHRVRAGGERPLRLAPPDGPRVRRSSNISSWSRSSGSRRCWTTTASTSSSTTAASRRRR